jgi:hypothetical protein
MNVEDKTLFVAWLVGVAHIVCGVGVLAAPGAILVTALASLHTIGEWIGLSTWAIGWVLVFAGIMAVYGSSARFIRRSSHLIMFVPQQALLLLMIWSITEAILTGRYPDGYSPPDGGYFVSTDQAFAWILGVSHSLFLAAYLYGSGRSGSHT